MVALSRDHCELATELIRRESAQSLGDYLGHVVIDSHPEPMAWGLCWEPWQRRMAAPLVPAIEQMAGLRSDYTGPRYFFYVMPRGHDKTGFIGRVCNWAVGFAKRSIKGVAAAADLEQAELLRDSMQDEINLNTWLDERLTVHRKGVSGAGGRLKIIAADAASSSGLKCDLFVCDEITFWKKRDLFDVLISGAEKRPQSVFIIITNAGLLDTWQHELLKIAKADPANWFVYEAPTDTILASWMTKERIEKIAELLPHGHKLRVIYNHWINGSMDEVEWPAEHFTSPDLWFDNWPENIIARATALDPSKGKSEKSDYSAFVNVAQTSDSHLWVDADLKRRPPGQIVVDGLEHLRAFRPHAFGIEGNAWQDLLAESFAAEARKQNALAAADKLTIHGAEVHTIDNSINKLVRIRRLDSPLRSGRFHFRRGHGTELLVSQMKKFPLLGNDDGPDALEMSLRLLGYLLSGDAGPGFSRVAA